MSDETPQDEATLYVLGLLSEQERLTFEAQMEQSSALCAEVASLNNATVALARATPGSAASLAAGRAKLMASLDSPAALPAGFHIIHNDDEGWQDTAVPGFRIKPLGISTDIGYQTLMVEFSPGTRYPAHLHESTEQLLVFSGTVQTEGCILGPGDFIHAEPGTFHQELYSHGGCRALLVRRAA
jgi:anti-sigma factor ChrR (cupin superfamily)